MADTVRSRAALLALLADNTSGDVSPQDARDLLVSLHGVYGEMYVADSSTGAQTIGTTFVKVDQLTSAGLSSGVTVDASTGHDLTVGSDGVYEVTLHNLSFSGTSNATFTVSIYHEGVRVPRGSLNRKIGTSGDVGAATLGCKVACSAGHTLSVYVKADGTGKSFLVQQANFGCVRIA